MIQLPEAWQAKPAVLPSLNVRQSAPVRSRKLRPTLGPLPSYPVEASLVSNALRKLPSATIWPPERLMPLSGRVTAPMTRLSARAAVPADKIHPGRRLSWRESHHRQDTEL